MYLYIFIDPDEWRDILWVFVSEGKDEGRLKSMHLKSKFSHD